MARCKKVTETAAETAAETAKSHGVARPGASCMPMSSREEANRLSVDALFIDEGFGSLSGVPLQHAIDLLNSLRRQLGRRVGVISHISALRESIPVQLHMVADPDTAATSIELWQNNLE